MSSCLFLIYIPKRVQSKVVLFRLGCLCCFDLFVYTPRVFGFRTSQLVYGNGLFLIDLLYFSFYELSSLHLLLFIYAKCTFIYVNS